MEKRVVVAIALSLLVLLSWSAFMSKQQPVETQAVMNADTSAPASIAEPVTVAAPVLPAVREVPAAELLKFESADLEVEFVESQSAIQGIKFKDHLDYNLKLINGFLLNEPNTVYKKTGKVADEITFVHSGSGKTISKRFSFSKSKHDIWLELKIKNNSSNELILKEPLILGVLDFSAKNPHAQYADVMVATQEKTQHVNAKKNLDFVNVKFIGLRDRYFCAIIEPQFENVNAFVRKINPTESEIGLQLPATTLAPNQEIVQKFHIYLGPQSLQPINEVKQEWAAIMNYGTFDFIAQLLVQLLEFIYRMVHNWGVAIIILSILVYLILYPLTLKQMRSMKEMQILQPKIEALRKEYKDNPQRLNKEIMALYKEHKVNPLGGCLPLLLQMPIFFALYQALMRSVALRGAKFLWIKDLSEPDKLFLLPFSIPILGNEFNLLPILMTIGMFIQQKFTTVSASGSSAEQQKIMMIIMPLMFGLIFYRMPSGLVLYWFVNSILMLVYQLKISKSK